MQSAMATTDDRRLSTRSRSNPGGMDVLSVLGPDVRPMRERKPPWFKVPAPGGERYRELTQLIKDENLHTVCQEAACPNVGECWERGTATFMILGDTCTRRCGFCNVRTGKPTWNDPLEPARVARSIAKMGLRHAVITSVDRDDLPDYGASAFVGVIRQIRAQAPRCKVEVLTPDFRGQEMPLAKVIAERPDVFNHNVEVVPRLYPVARRGSRFERSCRVLRNAKEMGGDEVTTKSGLMVGLGETHDEMVETFADPARARRAGAHRRPVPAPDRAPPAGRALLASRRVQGARGRPPTTSASTTSPPARSSAPATTPTSTSRRTSRAAARSRPPRLDFRYRGYQDTDGTGKRRGGDVAGKLKLYGFDGSNSVHTGRLMLEHKGADYDFVKLVPAMHAPAMLVLGFPTMGVPAIKVDGRRVQGTRWIARALDEIYPDAPRLFPADPAQRRKVQQAERWGEELQNAVRRIFYCAARRDRKAFLSVLASGRGPVKTFGLRMFAPVVIKLATGLHRASDEAGREDIELHRPSASTRSTRGSPRASSAARCSMPPTSRSASTSPRCCCPTISPRSSRVARPPSWRAASSPTTRSHRPRRPARVDGRPARRGRGQRAAVRRAARAHPRRGLPCCRTPRRAELMAATARLTRAERSAQTRDELLAAAQRRFFKAGYHATTLDDVADAAGYTKGAVYSTFGSKAGLFLALFDDIIDRRLAATRAIIDTEDSGSEASLRALADQPVQDPNARFLLLSIEFWVHAAREPALLDAFSQRYRRLRASLAELAPQDSPLDPQRWALVTLALSNGFALERLADPDGVPGDLMADIQSRLLQPQEG